MTKVDELSEIEEARRCRSRRRPFPGGALRIDPELAGLPVVAVSRESAQGCLGLPRVAPALRDVAVQARVADQAVADRVASSLVDPFVSELAHPGMVRPDPRNSVARSGLVLRAPSLFRARAARCTDR